jgi:hypothetical protein
MPRASQSNGGLAGRRGGAGPTLGAPDDPIGGALFKSVVEREEE